MRILPAVRAEFARLTATRMGKLSLGAIMIVPLVYGGLYLWGNQDPYENLDAVPAALVVSDAGATVDGSQVNYGEDAAADILDDGTFGWHRVSAADAAAGIEDGTYDFGITFPESFSADLASASGDHPVQAQLVLTTDDTNSYLSTTLAKQAAATVRSTIAAQVGENAAATLLDGIASIRDGLVDASSGASGLASGASDAAAGATSLASGAATLSSAATTLSSGATRVADGASTLATGASDLEKGTRSVSDGASSLASGASTLSAGAATLQSGTASLATAAPTVQAGVQQLLTAYGVPASSSARVLAGLQALTDGTASAASGAASLATGAATLSTGATTLASGADAAADGAASLSTGASKVSSGASDLAGGAAKLAAGASDAATGAASLADGVSDLSDGATKLDDGLTGALEDVPPMTSASRAATASAIGDPLEVEQDAVTEAGSYGAGLAPFFISLAAWIGIYALFLIVRPLSRRALTAVRAPIRTMLAGWATPALLGALQMVVLFAIVTAVLRVPVADAPGLLAFMAFVSITFAAIVLALNVLLGSVGQFLGLILMIVQLVTAGGTFPWQTLPAPLAALHYALPMGHAVDGVRQLMYGGSSAALWDASWPLAVWLVGALAAATYGAFRQGRFRTLRELRPSAIGA